jgi:hypothetical protein
VIVKGLVAAAFHNGKIGHLIASKKFVVGSGWEVRMGVVLDDGRTWHIRKENLGLVTGPQNP